MTTAENVIISIFVSESAASMRDVEWASNHCLYHWHVKTCSRSVYPGDRVTTVDAPQYRGNFEAETGAQAVKEKRMVSGTMPENVDLGNPTEMDQQVHLNLSLLFVSSSIQVPSY